MDETEPMKIHLINDAAAEGCLKEARRKHGLCGEILVVDDNVDVGPLREDATRDAWWRPIRDMYLNGLSVEMTSYGDQWSAILDKVQSLSVSEIVIWTSDAARDQTHLRVSLSKLQTFDGNVRLVNVPPSNGRSGLAQYDPKEVASLEAVGRLLDKTSRSALADDYNDRLAGAEGIRFQTDADLELRGYDCFDEAIVDACPKEWASANEVIGPALENCDGRNRVRDMFLRWRLKTLCDEGQLSAQGTKWFVDDCDVMVRR
jgi:hypothetical protein